jgi:hypothetical protein
VTDDLTAVRTILTDCRREGEPFPQAWERALQAVPPLNGRVGEAMDRRHVREALSATQGEWAAAYECRPGKLRAMAELR